jgi:hypothetical protein
MNEISKGDVAMGADQFSTYQEGADVDTAFRAVVDEAHYEHGHRGYTGTIAEKDEYVIVHADPLPRVVAEAMAEAVLRTDDPRVNNKWGPAGAIPVRADYPSGSDDGNNAVIGWLFFGWASS